MASLEICENCDRTIGKLETPMIWQGKVVCAECYQRLHVSSKTAAPAAADLDIDVMTPDQVNQAVREAKGEYVPPALEDLRPRQASMQTQRMAASSRGESGSGLKWIGIILAMGGVPVFFGGASLYDGRMQELGRVLMAAGGIAAIAGLLIFAAYRMHKG